MPKSFQIVLGIICVAAFILRLAYILQSAAHNPVFDTPFMDAGVHHEWAQKIASGEGYGPRPYFRAPLYYYVLAAVYALFGVDLLIPRLLQALLGAISCGLIGLLGFRLVGAAAGYIAAALAAVYWPFVYFDAELLTVNLEVFLNLLTLLLLYRANDTGRMRDFAFAGFSLGFAAITRANILLFGPAVFFWLLFSRPAGSRLLYAASRAAIVALCCLAVISPVTIRNIIIGKERVLIASSGGVNFFIGNNPHSDGFTAIVPGTRPTWWGGYEDTHTIAEKALGHKPTEKEVSQYWTQRAWQWITQNPADWLRLCAEKLRLIFHVYEIPNNQPDEFFFRLAPLGNFLVLVGFPLLASLAAAGVFCLRRRSAGWGLLGWYLLAYLCSLLAFFVNGRYRLPIAPVIILLAAAALAELWRTPSKAWRIFAVSAVAAFALFALSYDRHTFAQTSQAEGHFILGLDALSQDSNHSPDYHRAVRELVTSTRLRPTDSQAFFYLGLAHFGAGRKEAARASLEQALRLDPRYQEPKMALQRLDQGLDILQPVSSRDLFKQANLLAGEGRFREAIPLFRQAVSQDPQFAEAWQNLALAHKRLGQYRKAAEAMEQILKFAPNRPNTLANLVLLYAACPDAAVRNGSRALSLARKLQTLLPNHFLVRDALGMAYAELGRFEEAEKAALRAHREASIAGNDESATQCLARLQLYKQRKPFRSP